MWWPNIAASLEVDLQVFQNVYQSWCVIFSCVSLTGRPGITVLHYLLHFRPPPLLMCLPRLDLLALCCLRTSSILAFRLQGDTFISIHTDFLPLGLILDQNDYYLCLVTSMYMV